MAAGSGGAGFTWLYFALMTVCCWGLYGVFLHGGQLAMGDPQHGRYKAYLFVGLAYFLIAVLAPLVLLWLNGASWSFQPRGMVLSLVAGTVGAFGALFVLLAFGAKGTPPVVMSIVFAGAPIVNAVVSTAMVPGAFRGVRWPFILGILLAAIGGGLVTMFKPTPVHAPRPAAEVAADPR